MADITMCFGEGCPIRDACYRFNAMPDPLGQSYMISPYRNEAGECYSFWMDDSVFTKAKEMKINIELTAAEALLVKSAIMDMLEARVRRGDRLLIESVEKKIDEAVITEVRKNNDKTGEGV